MSLNGFGDKVFFKSLADKISLAFSKNNKRRENKMFLTCNGILGWSKEDIERLEKYIKVALVLDITMPELREACKRLSSDITDINTWYFGTLAYIFDMIVENIEERVTDIKLLECLKEIEQNFYPSKTYFNNFLDDIDLFKYEDKEELIDVLIEYLREKVCKK